jgi:hypothetical protein
MTTKMMTGAAVDMAVGSGIPRVTLRPHDAAGRSAAGLAATIATTTAVVPCLHVETKAGSPAHGRDTMMTTDALHDRAIAKRMMTGAVVAGMAVGTAIQRATPRRHGTGGMSVGGSHGRYRDNDDDRRHYMPARDDEGRFTSSRSSRYDDDDDDRRGGRGHGGWYGDPEGHSQAARRGRR